MSTQSTVDEESLVLTHGLELVGFGGPGRGAKRGRPPKPKDLESDPKAAKEALAEIAATRPLKPPGAYPYTIARRHHD